MMRRWASHWLHSCRQMPGRGRLVLARRGSDPDKQIHDFRRVMKAWRALLKLAPAHLADEAKALRAQIGHLRRGLGAARDASVVARTLGAVLPECDSKSDTPADAGEVLRQQRDAIHKELQRLAGTMAGWSVAAESGRFLVSAFKRSYRRARRRARRDPRRMGLKRLHAWRTAVVDLGYQLSFFQPADPARLGRQVETAEQLRAQLGAVVDLDMARAQLPAAASKRRREQVGREIERSIARQRRAAARIAGRLLDRRPRVVCARLAEAMARRKPHRIRLA
jgi:CHAD domain-containing protein